MYGPDIQVPVPYTKYYYFTIFCNKKRISGSGFTKSLDPNPDSTKSGSESGFTKSLDPDPDSPKAWIRIHQKPGSGFTKSLDLDPYTMNLDSLGPDRFSGIARIQNAMGKMRYLAPEPRLQTNAYSKHCLKLTSARNYRPCFRENQPKRSFSIKWKLAFWACFRENWVYKFGHRYCKGRTKERCSFLRQLGGQDCKR